MKKIKDERLILKNLKNLRIVYIVQTLGIIGILGYDWVTQGLGGMTGNPLWYVFMIATVVSAFLSMSIGVDHEEKEKSPKTGLWLSVAVLTTVCTLVVLYTAMSDGFTVLNGLVFGGVLFICGIIPCMYLYRLRRKKQEDVYGQ